MVVIVKKKQRGVFVLFVFNLHACVPVPGRKKTTRREGVHCPLRVVCAQHHVQLHLVSPQRSVVKQVTSFSCCMGFNMIYKDPPNAFDFFLQFQSKEFLCTAQVIDSAAKP